MRTLTAPDRPAATDRPTERGRWIWAVSGLVTIAALCVPVALLVTRGPDNGQGPPESAVPSRTVTVAATVTSLSVASYGSPIRVTTGPVRHVTVRESINYDRGNGVAPAVTDQVSDGRLTLAAPACATSDCSVAFTVTVPSGIAVTADSDGGNITVTDAAAANLDAGGGSVQAGHINGPLTISAQGGGITVANVTSPAGASLNSGGGPIQATGINGPLTVSAEGGGVAVNGLTGNLQADTGGGPFSGDSVTAGRVSVIAEGGGVGLTLSTAPAYLLVDTGGGPANVTFDAAPTAVTVSTDGGFAILNVPGGPYSVTADSDGGTQTVDVPTAPGAQRSLNVSTGGGPLEIAPR
jgi:hypothetical protein